MCRKKSFCDTPAKQANTATKRIVILLVAQVVTCAGGERRAASGEIEAPRSRAC